MAATTFVFTRPIEGKKFNAIAGMPVPKKYSSHYCLRQFKAQYGDDIVKPLDYSKPEDFATIIAAKGENRGEAENLQALAEEQAIMIRALRAENKELTRDLKRASSQKV